MFGEQQLGDALALHDVVFPRLQSDLVQRGVAVGVIAELEAVVEPHAESLDPLVNLAEFVQLPFVDESDHRNFLVAQRGQQLRRHVEHGRRGHRIGGAGGQVVNRDGNLAVGLVRGVEHRGIAMTNSTQTTRDNEWQSHETQSLRGVEIAKQNIRR